MKYVFIAAHEGEFRVKRMCQVLGVRRSGYYAWRKRQPSTREEANQALLALIEEEYQKSRKTYGSPRVHVVLRRRGVRCGRNRVARLMRLHGIVALKRRRYHPHTTQRQAGVVPAPNRLNQNFSATAPNQKWVSDFTYIETAEGWLYLAVVLDLFSRMVIGWAMSTKMDTKLVEMALRMALRGRRPPAGLLHHSDQGSQYTSSIYLNCLNAALAELSMSGAGNCYDNAVMESFFSTLKTECVTGVFTSRTEARTTIFEYLEVWYNRQRLHSTLGYLSPVDFEKQFLTL
jgi:putative transposase